MQMRWSGALSNLLHTLRHKLTITIDLRPLYHLMRQTFTDPLIGIEGDGPACLRVEETVMPKRHEAANPS